MLWFFALYVLLVGMLFSNLFVGIIITLFQEIESTRTTSFGLVRSSNITIDIVAERVCFARQLELIFSWQIIGMKKRKKQRFFKHLGYLASLLYAPAMKVDCHLRV